MTDGPTKNTDRELWRETPGDYYSPSIFVTEGGNIGINVAGSVIVQPVEKWHEAAFSNVAGGPEADRERVPWKDMFEECALARDASGFLGTVPQCIEYWCATAEAAEADRDEAIRMKDAAVEHFAEASEEIERLKNELGDPEGVIAHADAITAESDRLSARVAELERLLARVPGAMNGYFSAGIEEREGGSARRQEKLMADGEALIREIRDLATQKDKTDG